MISEFCPKKVFKFELNPEKSRASPFLSFPRKEYYNKWVEFFLMYIFSLILINRIIIKLGFELSNLRISFFIPFSIKVFEAF
jgi:hypothetical protein